MKKIIIIIAVFTSTASFAQRSFWSFNYEMSFAAGEQVDYISDPSFRGWGLEGRGFLTQNMSVGGSFSWQVFDQIYRNLPPTNLENETGNINGTITGTQYRFINTLPILFNGHYYLGNDGTMRPYFGLSIGTSWVEQRTDIGLISIQSEGWGFVVQPEFGLMIPFGLTGAGTNISGKFRYITKTADTIPISFFTLGIGLAFMN